MVMINMARAREIAEGQPDVSSLEFRNAVATARARSKACKTARLLDEARDVLRLLLAHGEPQQPPKMTAEELSQVRREAGHGARRATCKNALRRRLADARSGYLSVTDRKPAVFDAALEMIEDGEVTCVYQYVQTVYAGPISEGGRVPVRRVTIALPDARLPMDAQARQCQWKSIREQRRLEGEEQRI